MYPPKGQLCCPVEWTSRWSSTGSESCLHLPLRILAALSSNRLGESFPESGRAVCAWIFFRSLRWRVWATALTKRGHFERALRLCLSARPSVNLGLIRPPLDQKGPCQIYANSLSTAVANCREMAERPAVLILKFHSSNRRAPAPFIYILH